MAKNKTDYFKRIGIGAIVSLLLVFFAEFIPEVSSNLWSYPILFLLSMIFLEVSRK